MSLDRDKLAKVLAMTTSQHDGEALNAMRLANEMIKKAGLTWNEVVLPPADSGIRYRHVYRGPSANPYYSPRNDGPNFWAGHAKTGKPPGFGEDISDILRKAHEELQREVERMMRAAKMREQSAKAREQAKPESREDLEKEWRREQQRQRGAALREKMRREQEARDAKPAEERAKPNPNWDGDDDPRMQFPDADDDT